MRETIVYLVEHLHVAGWFFLVVGGVVLGLPRQVARLNAWSSKALFTDRGALKHPKATGVGFLLVAAFMFVLSALLR
jgi:hypothetical protein